MSCSQPLDLGIGGAGKALEPPHVDTYFSRGNPCEQEIEVGVRDGAGVRVVAFEADPLQFARGVPVPESPRALLGDELASFGLEVSVA